VLRAAYLSWSLQNIYSFLKHKLGQETTLSLIYYYYCTNLQRSRSVSCIGLLLHYLAAGASSSTFLKPTITKGHHKIRADEEAT
jgi:hypothetical protein